MSIEQEHAANVSGPAQPVKVSGSQMPLSWPQRLAGWWTAPIVAAGLVGGYGVASTTGVRPLGGLVLLAAGGLAGWIWWQRCSKLSTLALSGVFVGAFIASHPLAKKLGAWPSVLTMTAMAVVVTWLVADRKR